jgi:hypothetical protein
MIVLPNPFAPNQDSKYQNNGQDENFVRIGKIVQDRCGEYRIQNSKAQTNEQFTSITFGFSPHSSKPLSVGQPQVGQQPNIYFFFGLMQSVINLLLLSCFVADHRPLESKIAMA